MFSKIFNIYYNVNKNKKNVNNKVIFTLLYKEQFKDCILVSKIFFNSMFKYELSIKFILLIFNKMKSLLPLNLTKINKKYFFDFLAKNRIVYHLSLRALPELWFFHCSVKFTVFILDLKI